MSEIFNKIMIFGRPGYGKSTFAFKLHKLTGIPIYYLDKYFYESNWVERDYLEFIEIQKSIVDKASWIIDGNNTKSLEMRYSNADLVLYFNCPRLICLSRIVKRFFHKNVEIDDRAIGCPEVIRWRLIKYMWRFSDRVNRKIEELKIKYPNTRFVEIKSNKEILKVTSNLFGMKKIK